MANVGVNSNKLINFSSHNIDNDNSVFKTFDETPLGEWVEVRYLQAGDEIAVPDYESGAIKWERIASITILEPQHVYDLSIEGTRNFIANDIVAHNTYLATSSGNVGIGTTTPDNLLTIRGTDADSYLGTPSILHLNVTDSQNTTVTNIITLDHLLNNPENASDTKAGVTGGIGLGILFRAINNDSEIINVSFINATLVRYCLFNVIFIY